MANQELNKKLAEWAGFRVEGTTAFHWNLNQQGNNYSDIITLNFTESLDACFKHLVPKAIDKIMIEQECSNDIAYAILFKKWLQELELIIPKSALALCLAVEKLTDGEKNGK